MSFLEYYDAHNETDILLKEFTWGQLGKGLFRVAKNLMGKRYVGVQVNMMSSFKEIDRSTYNFVQGALTRSFETKDKKDKGIHIEEIYRGEIDDSAKRLGGYENIKKQIQDISVYQTNKGGRITTFYLLDEDGDEKFYIGTNWRGDKQFKDIFGVWVTGLTSRLNYRQAIKAKPTKASKKSKEILDQDLASVFDNPKEYLTQLEPEPEPKTKIEKPFKSKEEEPEEKTSIGESKMGVVDIQNHEAKSLIDSLSSETYKNIITTKTFKNNFGIGNKYKVRTGQYFYVLQGYYGDDGKIVFDSDLTYDAVKKIGLLDDWIGTSADKELKRFKDLPVKWENIDINNM